MPHRLARRAAFNVILACARPEGEESVTARMLRPVLGEKISSVAPPPAPPVISLGRHRDSAGSLDDACARIPEIRLVRSLLRTCVGFDSDEMAWDPTRRVFAPTSATTTASASQAGMAAKIGEAGWLVRKIQSWIDRACLIDGSSGLVRQALGEGIRSEVQEYLRWVSALEVQQRVAAANALAAGLDTSEGSAALSTAPTTRRVVVWLDGPLARLRLLATIASATDGLEGGVLASAVWSYGEHGGELVRDTVRRVLQRAATPLLSQLRRWCLEGELRDDFGEFFVRGDPSIPVEELWQRRYRLVPAQLPVFFSRALCEQALLVGKSIDFLRSACDDVEWILSDSVSGDSAALSALTTWRDAFLFEERGLGVSLASQRQPAASAASPSTGTAGLSALEALVGRLARRASSRVLSVMTGRFRLRQHMEAIRKYMLLVQGDFVLELMRSSQPHLSLPAHEQTAHVLLGVLEGAIRSSTAQFDDREFLDRLNVKLLTPSPGDRGWDVFCLTYDVTAPLTAVFHPLTIRAYERLFLFLWKVKRAEWALSNTWCHQAMATHRLGRYRELSQVLHRAHLLRSDMCAFASTLSSYCMFEVLDTSWKELQDDLDEAEDLPSVIAAHDKYVRAVARKALITGGRAERDVSPRLHELLDWSLRFARMQERMFESMLGVHERHEEEEGDDKRKEARRKRELGELASGYGKELDTVARRYRGAMLRLLAALDLHGSGVSERADREEEGVQELRFLFFRFDFNSFYETKWEAVVASGESLESA
jgi:gamma-tubulin complex component 3